MPLPMWAAAMGAQALQDPAIQRGLYNTGGAILGGAGRGVDYLARGAGGLAQEAGGGLADILGGLGERVLPQSAMNIGRGIRGGIGRVGSGIGGFYNAVTGGNQPQQMGGQQMMPGMGMGIQGMGRMGQMDPTRALQQQYTQMLGQPYDYQHQAQNLLNQYQQQTTPQINRMFANTGGLGSGAQRRALSSAHTNLLTNLGMLGEENMGQRRREMGNYVTGQQQIGLAQRRLAQEGGIANQQEALRQMGLMGGFAQDQQRDYINQLLNAINAQGGMGNIGIGAPFSPVMTQGSPSGFSQLLGAALPWMVKAGANYMGIPT